MDKDPVIQKIKQVTQTISNDQTVKIGLSCMDLTSLNGDEITADIQLLCDKARAGCVGGVCVYPKHVGVAADYLQSHNIAIATVINFPHGDKTNEGEIATPDNTYDAVKQAIANGATEIDIVVDYNDFTEENAKTLLRACRNACDEGHAKMKVILEVENGNIFADLPARCELAICEGADMIKTSTGKYPEKINDTEKMESVLIMIDAIKKQSDGRDVGLKISGGVNGKNYAQYITLVEQEVGAEFMNPQTFRLGASGLYDDLKPSHKPNKKSVLAY